MTHKQTVLIVDDNADNVNVAAQTLIQNDINVILALSGKEALKSVSKFMPDLILLDIMMPGMDGFEVCKILKSNPETKHIPVIFLSAINETTNIVKGFELGAVDYINKPFISKELISRVKTHLKIHSQFIELQNKEKLVLDSKSKLKSVINSIPDLIFYKDLEGKYTGVNNAYAKHLKQLPENIIGKTDFDFFNPKEAKVFSESDQQTFHTNEDYVYEEWTKDFSGNEVYLDTRKTPLVNSDGITIGIVGVSRDISELKIIEKTLKENEEKLQTIYDNANEGIFVLQNYKVVFLNHKLCEITAYSKEEIQNRFFIDFIHKEDKKKAAGFYQKKLAGVKIGQSIIFRIIDKTNKVKYVKINSKQIDWNEGKAILSLLDDITEQYLLEEKLFESNERLRLSQKAGKIGTWDWNIETGEIKWSDLTFKILGIKKYDNIILNHDFNKYVHQDDKERIESELKNSLKNKSITHKTEFRIIKPDNQVSWVEETSEIIYNTSKKPKRMIGVLQDITERKNTEKEIELKNSLIKEKQEDLLASIRYAKTIQTSLLPEQSEINKIIKNNFIIFKPKDIVSGDFYYVNKIDHQIYFSVADCTGHGIPGGFLTMLGVNIIHGILKHQKIKKPSEILCFLRARIKEVFKGVEKNNINGIDLAFCTIDLKTNILQYSGAFNPLWIIRDNELIEFKATRNPIGYYPVEKKFKNHIFQLQNKDKIYLFSDGFKDQIGGKPIQKYNNKRFKELLVRNAGFSMKKQNNIFMNELEKWKTGYDQIDDITIMGIEWEM